MLANFPDVFANDRQIPPGKVLVAEYGRQDGPLCQKITIAEFWHPVFRAKCRLIARVGGWAIAGSMLRWDNGAFGCIFENSNGTTSGQWFKTYEPAAERFESIRTKTIEESKQ